METCIHCKECIESARQACITDWRWSYEGVLGWLASDCESLWFSWDVQRLLGDKMHTRQDVKERGQRWMGPFIHTTTHTRTLRFRDQRHGFGNPYDNGPREDVCFLLCESISLLQARGCCRVAVAVRPGKPGIFGICGCFYHAVFRMTAA